MPERFLSVGIRLIAVYIGAHAIVSAAGHSIVASLGDSWRLAWRFILADGAALIVAVLLWSAADTLARSLSAQTEDRSDAPALTASTVARIGLVLLGAAFTVWGVLDLAQIAAARPEASRFAGIESAAPGWWSAFRDDLVRACLQVSIGLLLVFRARPPASLDARATDPAGDDPGEREDGERVTFTFD